ncbi:MFS transporter [uncultured Nisaea sp.]|uniref:MFS transporter n=1 Tax=uncultured Nisaea sp. TaxID=538215 RepID=UPI0030ECB618|tara:strand:+ start:826 stop:2052 length:1227 start_codon:yes stop_codon:yes gene_type:complete
MAHHIETQPTPPLRDTVTVVFFMIWVQLIGSMASLWLPAIAPEAAAALGIDASLIGLQVVVVYLGGMITSLFAGGLVARLGAWRVSQVSLGLFALAHLIISSGALPLMALGSFIIGFGYGLINPPAAHLMSKVVTPKNRNLVFSIRFTGVPLGGIAASTFAPAIALSLDWQSSMYVTIGVAVAMVFIMEFFRKRWDSDRSRAAPLFRSPLADIKAAWKLPAIRWLCFTGLFLAAIQLSLNAFAVTFLVEETGYTLVAAGLALTAVQVAGVIGRIAWGVLADRIRSGFTALIINALLTALSALATVFVAPEWPVGIVYLLFFIFGFTAMGWNGVFASAVVEHSPQGKAGNMTGAALFFTFSGVIVGPAVFTLGYQLVGTYSGSFMVTAILALAGTGTIILAAKGARKSL